MKNLWTLEWEHSVLTYNPFEGDFGEGEIALKDKIVVTRKPHDDCHNCAGQIAAGEVSRVKTEITYDGISTYRWCFLCCDAMAKSWDDNGEAIEQRCRDLRVQS